MTSVFSSRAPSQLAGPVCSPEIEKAFGAVMGVLTCLRFSRGSPLIHGPHELVLLPMDLGWVCVSASGEYPLGGTSSWTMGRANSTSLHL